VPLLPAAFSKRFVRRFGRFVASWLPKNLQPLDRTTDVSRAHWLKRANYPLYRKEELLKVPLDFDKMPSKYVECHSFIKDESYPDFKYPRTINPRPDTFKVFSGPIFKLIEEEVFKLKYFIKKIPRSERAAYIKEHVGMIGALYGVTDFTSFESSFTPEIMEACEMRLYKYMSQYLDGGQQWYEEVHKALTGMQKIKFNGVTATTKGTRMSGDMCTSLGNGFTNLMLNLFAAHECGLGELHGVFEGDDGLMRFSSGRLPDPGFYEKLGFTVKMEKVSSLFEASFCGMVFDEHSEQTMSDPREWLAELGWTSAQYLGAGRKTTLGLLRAKALSGLYEWKGSPVVPYLCRRVVELTEGYDERVVLKHKNTNMYMRGIYEEVFSKSCPFEEPTEATRSLFAARYSISVQKQLELELQFSKQNLGPMKVDLDFPIAWRFFWDAYVDRVGTRNAGIFTASRFNKVIPPAANLVN
jgi:hypothetical protein